MVELPQMIGIGSATAPGLVPSVGGGGSLALLDPDGEVRPLDEIEADAIRFAIAHYRGQMSEVARRLKIGRSTLYRKLDYLGLGENDAETDPEAAVAR
jgi:DNA-binding NtrC family response regulator